MLEGVTVLSTCQALAGPKATQLLADLGADVVKVEDPDGGDLWRDARLPGSELPEGFSYPFGSANKGKRSIAIDLTTDDGRELFEFLAEEADVLVDNMTTGRMESLGLGYDALREVNEELIYCSISGYGETGPYSDRRSMDIMAQAMAGIMEQNQKANATAEPAITGFHLADALTGVYAATATLAALVRQRTTEEGTFIDVSMVDCLVSMLDWQAAQYTRGDDVSPPPGGYLGPRGLYGTATDPIVIYVPTEPEAWLGFCELTGVDDYIDPAEYERVEDRTENEEVVEAAVTRALASEPREYWLDHLSDTPHVWSGPVLGVAEAFEHEQLAERDVVSTSEDDDIGSYLDLRFPGMFSNDEGTRSENVPRIGEHSTEVLRSVGFSDEEIQAFRDGGTVAGAE